MAIPRRVKAGYGAADFGLSAAELLLQLYLLEFYIVAVGLPPALAGFALAIAVLWDAISDPMMGALLDHTKTKWGRFNPYLAGGAILFALSLVALFTPPDTDSHLVLTLYLSFSYILVNTGLTVVGIPHLALAATLSSSTHERTELYGWKLGFGTTGLFFGILSPLIAASFLSLDVETLAGLQMSRQSGSVIVGVILVMFVCWTLLATGRRSSQFPSPKGTFNFRDILKGTRAVFANRYFLPIFLSFLLVAAGRAMNSTLALPYYKESLSLPEEQIQGPILGVFTLVIVLSVPVWVAWSRRVGKKMPAIAGMGILGLMTCIVYPLFPAGGIAGPVAAAVLGGFAVGAIILFESLLTDISRREENADQQPMEGLYFGYWRMGQKVVRSIMLGLTGLLLAWIGYDEALTTQSEETGRKLAWIFGPGVGALFILAAIIFSRLDEKSLRKDLVQ